MKEKTIYEIIKRLIENKGNKKRAAIRLGCTERYVNKLITNIELKVRLVLYIRIQVGNPKQPYLKKQRKGLLIYIKINIMTLIGVILLKN